MFFWWYSHMVARNVTIYIHTYSVPVSASRTPISIRKGQAEEECLSPIHPMLFAVRGSTGNLRVPFCFIRKNPAAQYWSGIDTALLCGSWSTCSLLHIWNGEVVDYTWWRPHLQKYWSISKKYLYKGFIYISPLLFSAWGRLCFSIYVMEMAALCKIKIKKGNSQLKQVNRWKNSSPISLRVTKL